MQAQRTIEMDPAYLAPYAAWDFESELELSMNDILRALLIAAGLLVPVVILFIGISMVAIKRGEASHRAGHEVPEEESAHVTPTAGAAAAAKPAKAAAAPAGDEISVPKILGLGVGLFVLTILALLALSLIAHM
jgi:hypothetical protein